jgi:hypothetical protein
VPGRDIRIFRSMECAIMNLTLVENESDHVTVVNAEQVTYLRQDSYGTSIHFTSG